MQFAVPFMTSAWANAENQQGIPRMKGADTVDAQLGMIVAKAPPPSVVSLCRIGGRFHKQTPTRT
jgi:hypothetical protein